MYQSEIKQFSTFTIINSWLIQRLCDSTTGASNQAVKHQLKYVVFNLITYATNASM